MIVAVVCAMLSLLTVRRPRPPRRRGRRAGRHSRGDGLRTRGEDVVHAWAAARARGPVERPQGRVGRSSCSSPRSRLAQTFGIGLTNKSFDGLPIDNSWLATYQDQGLFGVAICAAIIISLLLLATTRPRGPSTAIAVFLVVYCTVASFTETGLGDASPYVLDLAVAASLLAAPGDAIVRVGVEGMRILVAHNRYRSTSPGGEDRVVDQEHAALVARGPHRRAIRALQRRHRADVGARSAPWCPARSCGATRRAPLD